MQYHALFQGDALPFEWCLIQKILCRYVRETHFSMTITTRDATMGLSNTVENAYVSVDVFSCLGHMTNMFSVRTKINS